MSTALSIIPRLSEQAYAMAADNVYIFDVPTSANKQQIAAAVAAQFNVNVIAVRTAVIKGKVIRSVRKRKSVTGKRSNIKKAYVTLAKDSKLAIFDQPEEKK